MDASEVAHRNDSFRSQLSRMKLFLTILTASIVGGLAWVGVASFGPRTSRSNDLPATPESAPLRNRPEEASPAQQAALADGIVTWDEYAAAVQANTRCIRDAGIPVSDPQLLPGKVLNGTAGPFATEDEMNRASPKILACNAEHLNAVATRWTTENAPSAAKLEEARLALRECLSGQAVTVGVNNGRDDFVGAAINHPAEFSSCAGKVSEEFQIAHFGG